MAIQQSSTHQTATLARRQRVRELSATFRSPTVIAERLADEGLTNPRTRKPYTESTVRGDLRMVSEMIGREVTTTSFWQAHRFAFTVDWFRTDYAFWDRLRNCKAVGYELAGLFCRPINQILASYVFGERPTYTIVDAEDVNEDARNKTDALLARFMTQNHAVFLAMLEDLYGLADQFVIVNPDGTLSIPSPDTVDPQYDPLDYRRLTKVTITTRSRGTLITDVYTEEKRVLTIRRGQEVQSFEFENLLGRIPIVHFANNRRSGEMFGRVEYEALLPLFSAYDDQLTKTIDGVRLLSNPVPVYEGMEDIQATIDANATPTDETYLDDDGNTVTRQLIAYDTLGSIFVGKGGKFEFKAPQVGFTEDSFRTLDNFFKLMLQHIRIPEVTWGSAIGGSNATAEIQLPPFIRVIKAKQIALDGQGYDLELGTLPRGGMYEVIDLFLRMRRLTDPDIIVAPVQSRWADVDLSSEQIRLQKIIFASGSGDLSAEERLDLLRLVSNPAKSVARARAEAPSEQDFMTQLNAVARKNMNEGDNLPDGTRPNMKDVEPPLPAGGRRPTLNDGKPIGEMESSKQEKPLANAA